MDKASQKQVNFIFQRIQLTGTPHMVQIIISQEDSLKHIEALDKWSASMLIDAINAMDDHKFDDVYYGYQVQGDNK